MKLKKYLSKIIAFSMGLCIMSAGSGAYADSTINLTAEANNEGNYVSLKWNAPDSQNNYSYMLYCNNSLDSEYQSIPAKSTVKVLNVYPVYGNNVKGWMENPNSESENGYGKGLITVDEVNIDTFNSNPYAYLKDSNGDWKYDVVYEGAWDWNNYRDFSAQAATAMREFIEAGRGFLCGHDCMTTGLGTTQLPKNTNKLADKLNVTLTSSGGIFGNKVRLYKKGLLTNYPWNIGDVGTVLSVPQSHTTGQFANGDIWLRYEGQGNVGNNFYLTTWNNTAMIQTGHSSGKATPDEQKILANTLFYLSQTTDATDWDDHKGQDLDSPTMPSINSVVYDATNNNINVSYMPSTDKGTTYSYYVEATNKSTKEKIKSDTKTVTVTTGLKGYSIVVDNKADTIPSSNITTTETNATVSMSGVEAKDFYVHVAAVDNAGNISEVSHYKYGYPLLTLTPSTTETTDAPVTITAVGTSTNSKVSAIQTPTGSWVYSDKTDYVVNANGTYTFYAIDENGIIVSQSITVSNIDDSKVILNIEPEKDKIFLEQEVEADLTIDNIKEIAAEDVRIKYDNSKLQFLGMEEVPGIKVVKDEHNDGELRVILASQGISNVVFVKKTLLKLHFKGIAEGEALVDVTKGRVSDGILMERDLFDNQCGQATIFIEDYKDVNKSGEFTLLDLAIDGRYYGLNPLDYPQYKTDIAVNGAIDDEDLLQIGQYMLENPNYNF